MGQNLEESSLQLQSSLIIQIRAWRLRSISHLQLHISIINPVGSYPTVDKHLYLSYSQPNHQFPIDAHKYSSYCSEF